MYPIFPPFLPFLFSTPLQHALCLHFPDAFCLFSSQLHFLSCFHACHFIHCPSYLPICLCSFMLTLVLCIIHAGHFIHAYCSHHASWFHFIHAFPPIILVTLFFICALIFISSSYVIQLVHSIHALVHLFI